jgi:acyl carrier protein
MDASIFERVIRTLGRYARQADLSKITAEASLADDLDVNSARLVDLVLALEDEFGITVRDDDIEKLRTVGNIVAYIQQAAISQ